MKKLSSLFMALPLVAILMFGTFVFAAGGDIVIEGKYVEVPSNGMFYSASYFSDYNEADQGVTGNGKSAKAYIDTISTDSASLIFRHNSGAATTTYTFSTDETIPANINVIIEKGAILSIANTKTLTINGPFDAGLYQVFSGSGTVGWGNKANILNQLYFGVNDAALVMAVRSLADGVSWYLPSETYTQTTKITLPDGVAMFGDGSSTLINSAVTGDWAIVVGAGGELYGHKTCLRNFKLLGDMTNSAASTGTGGIKFNDTDYEVIRNVRAEGFGEGTWNTAGNPATEATAAGFWVSGTVGLSFEGCYARRNDVGFLIDEGVQSVNTATQFYNCKSRLNRTHGLKWGNTMTTLWAGGIIESNNGLVTVKINCATAGADINNTIQDTHFEGNQRISGAAAANSREIEADLNTGNLIVKNNIFTAGATYADVIVEITDTKKSLFEGNYFALGATGTETLIINNTCYNTTLISDFFSKIPNDSGINTKMFGQLLLFGNGSTLTGATPSVSGETYVTLPTGTISNFTNGTKGQIIICKTVDGTALNGANFLLKNSDTYMRFAANSRIALRYTGSVWELIWHLPGGDGTTLANAATVCVKDSEVCYVGDANTAAIATIGLNYNNQRITIISEHTGANTTTFIETGNLMLAGNFVMGIGDTLTLIYRNSVNKWYEVSRSSN